MFHLFRRCRAYNPSSFLNHQCRKRWHHPGHHLCKCGEVWTWSGCTIVTMDPGVTIHPHG